jgi:WD40 repeat protein
MKINSLALLTNGNIISASHDATFEIWNTITTQCIRSINHDQAVFSMAMLSNDKLATCNSNGNLYMGNN